MKTELDLDAHGTRCDRCYGC